MDIPFEKLTVKEVTQALEAHATPAHTPDWAHARSSDGSDRVKVTKEAMAWLAKLPLEVRPKAVANQYPRIFNKLAAAWARPLLYEQCLDELMLDARGTRQGFPPEIAAELHALRAHFLATSKSVHFDVFGNRIGTGL